MSSRRVVWSRSVSKSISGGWAVPGRGVKDRFDGVKRSTRSRAFRHRSIGRRRAATSVYPAASAFLGRHATCPPPARAASAPLPLAGCERRNPRGRGSAGAGCDGGDGTAAAGGRWPRDSDRRGRAGNSRDASEGGASWPGGEACRAAAIPVGTTCGGCSGSHLYHEPAGAPPSLPASWFEHLWCGGERGLRSLAPRGQGACDLKSPSSPDRPNRNRSVNANRQNHHR